MSALDFFDTSVRQIVQSEPKSGPSTPKTEIRRQLTHRAPLMCLPWQPGDPETRTESCMVKRGTSNRMQPRDDATCASSVSNWRQERIRRDRQEWEALRELMRFLEHTSPSAALGAVQSGGADASDMRAHEKAVRFSQLPPGQETNAGVSEASKRRTTTGSSSLTGGREAVPMAVQPPAPASTSSPAGLHHPRFFFERRLRTVRRSGSALSLFTGSKDTHLHESHKRRKEDCPQDEQPHEAGPSKGFQDDHPDGRKCSSHQFETRNPRETSTKTGKQTQPAVERNDSGIGTPENERSSASAESRTCDVVDTRTDEASNCHGAAEAPSTSESRIIAPTPTFDQLTRVETATSQSMPSHQAAGHPPRGSSLIGATKYDVGAKALAPEHRYASTVQWDASATGAPTTPSNRKDKTRARKLRDRHTLQPSIDHVIREPLLDGDGRCAISDEGGTPNSDAASSGGPRVASRRTPAHSIQRQMSRGPPASATPPPPTALPPTAGVTTLDGSTARPATPPQRFGPILSPPFTTPLSGTRREYITSSARPDAHIVEPHVQARLHHLERQNRLLDAALTAAIATAGQLNKCPCTVDDRTAARGAGLCNAESPSSTEGSPQRHAANASEWSAASSEQGEESALTLYMATRQTAMAAHGKVIIV